MKALRLIFCLAFISSLSFAFAFGQEKTDRDSLFSEGRLDSLIYSKKELLGDWGRNIVYLKDNKAEPVPMPNAMLLMQGGEHHVKWKKIDGKDCAPMPNAVKTDDSLGSIIIRPIPADSLRRDSLFRKRE